MEKDKGCCLGLGLYTQAALETEPVGFYKSTKQTWEGMWVVVITPGTHFFLSFPFQLGVSFPLAEMTCSCRTYDMSVESAVRKLTEILLDKRRGDSEKK